MGKLFFLRPVAILWVIGSLLGCTDELTTEPQTPANNTNPATDTCKTDNADYLNSSFATANFIQGGLLYDKSWIALGFGSGPVISHDMWSLQSSNTRFGSDTWRCKECHGWDYKGKDGAYASGGHATGFPGVLSTSVREPIDVFCAIHSGTGINPLHRFNSTTPAKLTDQAILQLTRFILDQEDKGIIDMDPYIDAQSRLAINGVVSTGKFFYEGSAGCSASTCHAIDGSSNAGDKTLGILSNSNPWEVLHKIRYGHPGTSMPSAVRINDLESMSIINMVNILAYTQTLPQPNNNTPPPPPPPATEVQQIVRGGLLYDDWMATREAAVPANNPMWALQTSNTRTGRDTWRCKECHGWDYKGKNGAYGPASNHFTGFGGVLRLVTSITHTEEKIISFLRLGKQDPVSGQVFHAYNGLLSEEDFMALAKFIKKGVVDTDLYIFPTWPVALGDLSSGTVLYKFDGWDVAGGYCDLCHGADGQQLNFGTSVAPEYLGAVSNSNPWEVLHKIRFGHPGSQMPSTLLNGLSTQQAVDILTFTQTLP